MSDPHDLQRFVDAQDRGGTYDRALQELRDGRPPVRPYLVATRR